MRRTHLVLRKHFGAHIPHPYELSRNVSFILQNGHAVLSYPRAFNPWLVFTVNQPENCPGTLRTS